MISIGPRLENLSTSDGLFLFSSSQTVPAGSSPFSFGLSSEATINSARSKLMIADLIRDPETGEELGSVRLSEGPDYGSAILRSVAWGWGFASAIAEQARLAFEQDLPSAPVFIRADGSEILRAIDNLVENACKFISPDGIIRLSLSQEEGQAMISVIDTGIGISGDDLPQLFHRFDRGRNATPYPGSGLGLAIVKAIVTAHKGRVEVQSAGEGKGSRFLITLPVISS